MPYLSAHARPPGPDSRARARALPGAGGCAGSCRSRRSRALMVVVYATGWHRAIVARNAGRPSRRDRCLRDRAPCGGGRSSMSALYAAATAGASRAAPCWRCRAAICSARRRRARRRGRLDHRRDHPVPDRARRLRRATDARAPARCWQSFAAGFRADAFSYILFLRLVPSPSWLTSMASGSLGVRLRHIRRRDRARPHAGQLRLRAVRRGARQRDRDAGGDLRGLRRRRRRRLPDRVRSG